MKPKSSSAVRIWMVLLTAACSSDRNLPQKMCHPWWDLCVQSNHEDVWTVCKILHSAIFWAQATQAPRVIFCWSAPYTCKSRRCACHSQRPLRHTSPWQKTVFVDPQSQATFKLWSCTQLSKQSEHIRKQTINLSLPQEYHRLLCLLKTHSKNV